MLIEIRKSRAREKNSLIRIIGGAWIKYLPRHKLISNQMLCLGRSLVFIGGGGKLGQYEFINKNFSD